MPHLVSGKKNKSFVFMLLSVLAGIRVADVVWT